MGILLLAWGLAFVACMGLGLLGTRVLGVRELDADRGFQAFWIGLALALFALQVWHLVLPVTPVTAGLLFGAGVAGLVLERRRWLALRPSWVLVGVSVLVAVWVANLAVRGLQHYDTGLYLLGGVNWAAEHRAVPGLGNLHGRFAFNNAHLLYAALFRFGPWAERVPNAVNGSLLVVLLAQCAWCGRRLLAEARAEHAFGLVMALPALVLAKIYLVSLSTDLPATILAMLVAWRTFRLVAGEAEGREREEMIGITLLAAAAVSVKLSCVLFVSLCWLLAVAHAGGARRRYALAAAVFAVALLPWLARGIVLSGYPLYPIHFVSAPVSWRIPEKQAISEAESVRGWARVPGVPKDLTLEGWYWLESWSRRNLRLSLRPSFPLPLLLGLGGIFAVAAAGSAGRGERANRGLLLLGPAAVAFGFWFWFGPDPRFAMFVFWSVAATGLAAAVGAWEGHAGVAVAVGVAAFALAVVPKDLVSAGPEVGFHPAPTAATRIVETRSGLRLYVPVESDQCWDAALPCTPYPRSNLRLRLPGIPASGFIRGT